ncbi:hypothetical protein [Acanthopleuribacter pedis]|uniref:Uncharacterized protein n=1 Tax=Acanthopleuribacter pedis TaxID=442870 RepID=A0A8J7U782_9BACT|nr:hypothetical protein [Acanthopleuribacter pedis]MBO1322228.1 hypothetical protein [Acanthopleuribacter pedis]
MAALLEKRRTLIGLALIYAAAFTNQNWVWGLLYLFWVIPDLFTGETHFIEHLRRDTDPVLYWIVMVTLLVLSAYVLIEPLLQKLT